MAAWTVLDPAKEARAVLDEMAKNLLDDPSMPAPAQLQSPPAEVLRTLMAGNAAGQAIGKATPPKSTPASPTLAMSSVPCVSRMKLNGSENFQG